MKKIIFIMMILLIILSYSNITFAVSQYPVSNLQDLADLLAKEGDSGIEIDRSSIKLFKGNINQIGTFENATSVGNKGFDNINEGIILTSGTINQNMFQGYTSHPYPSHIWNAAGWVPGNPLPGNSFDSIYLTFNVKSHTNSIAFQYIFASEEFDQSPTFNDQMFIRFKKKGEPDSSYNNIAINPNYTADGLNSGIDISINNLRNTAYHYDNLNGRSSDVFSFLGYTPLLTCKAEVEPDVEYTFLIGLLDVGDPIFDTALLLKSHSLMGEVPPPSEENPDPPTRKIFSPKKEISAVQVTLANGTILHSATVIKDASGNPKLNSSSNGVLLVGDKNLYNIYITMDEELMHGAKLQVEYKINIENSSANSFSGYTLGDVIDKKFYYNPDEILLTESLTNASVGWNLQTDNTLKLDSSEIIPPSSSISKKVIFSRILTSSSENYGPYINLGAIVCKYQPLSGLHADITPPEKIKSGEVFLLPPTGREILSSNYIIGFFSLLILTSIVAYMVYKKK